jgi:trigger factor
MTVKSKESVGPCEVSLDIEVESARVAEAVDRVYREFSKFIAVPGFRKGKAPLSFVKPRVSTDQLRERTAEILVGPAYEKALSENDIQPFARPRVELVKLETSPPDFILEFKAIVPLPPKVALGDYKGVAVERESVLVAEADIDERIEALRTRLAEYPLVEDRGAENGDVVVGELAIDVKGPENVPGVDQHILGVKATDEKEFDIDYPESYPNASVAGKSAHFILRVQEVRTKVLPELDAAFAQKLMDVDSMELVRERLRSDMEKARRDNSEAALETSIVEKVVEGATIEYPSVLIDIEVEDDVREFREDLERRQVTPQAFFEQSGTTPEVLNEQFRTRADARLKRGLALGEIAKQEELQINDDDINSELERRAASQNTTPQAVRAFIDRTNGTEGLRNMAFTRKILDFLKSQAVITDKQPVAAAAPAEAAVAEPKAPKTRKKKAEAAPAV